MGCRRMALTEPGRGGGHRAGVPPPDIRPSQIPAHFAKIGRMSTYRKDLSGPTVVRRQDGSFVIGGSEERKLVGPGSKRVTLSAPPSGRPLSALEIQAFARRMKVAV